MGVFLHILYVLTIHIRIPPLTKDFLEATLQDDIPFLFCFYKGHGGSKDGL